MQALGTVARLLLREWVPSGGVVSSIRSSGAEPAVGSAGQLPAALMDRPMMGTAQQGEIPEVGRAAVDPVPQMMTLAPGQRPVAVWEDAAAVADGQGGPLGGLDDPGAAADVQGSAGRPTQGRGQPGHGRPEPGLEVLRRVKVKIAARAVDAAARAVDAAARADRRAVLAGGLAADQHPGHGRVARQSPAGLRVQRSHPPRLPTEAAGAALETFQADGDQQLRADPTRLGQLATLQGPAAQLGQGVGVALVGVAGVLGISGRANGSRAAWTR